MPHFRSRTLWLAKNQKKSEQQWLSIKSANIETVRFLATIQVRTRYDAMISTCSREKQHVPTC